MIDRGGIEGLLVAGSAVILTGPAAERALQAVLIAIRARRSNGYAESPEYRLLAESLARARSATGHADFGDSVLGQHLRYEPPTVPLPEAARRIGVGLRQARRLAPRLGGTKVGGRWFVDGDALDEHLYGKAQADGFVG